LQKNNKFIIISEVLVFSEIMNTLLYLGFYPNVPKELVLATQDANLFGRVCSVVQDYQIGGLVDIKTIQIAEWGSNITAINPPLPAPTSALVIVSSDAILYPALLDRLVAERFIDNMNLLEAKWRLGIL
jgi:hypothetical protein